MVKLFTCFWELVEFKEFFLFKCLLHYMGVWNFIYDKKLEKFNIISHFKTAFTFHRIIEIKKTNL